MTQLVIMDIVIALTIQISGIFSVESMDSNLLIQDCTECHSDMVEHEVLHMPVEACDNCHESTGVPHPQDGEKGFKLIDQMPDLCFYCHEEPVTKTNGHQPVERKDCLACHDVHGSSEPTLLKLSEQELCLNCHQGIRQLISRQNIPHSAIPGGGCTLCHQAHGSGFRVLLNEAYPAGNYAVAKTESFELCFQCHDTDLIDSERTEWGTNFRNGDRNLHQLHINGNKGRNCRLCHNMHGSTQKYLIEQNVGFGNWEMKMNFIPVENGGSCLPGCHGRQSYVR